MPFAHLGSAESHVARNVLEQDLAAQEILHFTHPGGDVPDCLFGVRNRQQVVQILAGYTGPAQMVGDPRRFHAFCQLFQRFQVIAVQRISAADR